MKKITLLITLMITSLGFAQQVVVQNFEAGGVGAPFGGAAAALAPNPSGTGQVAMLSSKTGAGTAVWQGVNISLTQNVRLTTDKTMSMDVYSTTPITIAPKVIGGLASAPDSTTRVSHTGTGWETLTFTFNLGLDGSQTANGDYTAFVIYYNWNTATNNFGTQDTRIFYVDNIKGVGVAPPVELAPTVAAPPAPNRPAADVKSIFSNAYTPITTFNYAGVDGQPSNDNTYDTSWSSANTTLVQIAGDDTNKMTGMGFQGIAFLGGRFDATTFTTLHIDIWTSTETLDKSFNLKLVNFNGGSGESNAIEKSLTNASNPPLPNPNPGTWISYDIPLSTFTIAGGGNASRNDLAQFVITSNLGTVYYDNLYFHKNTLGTQKFDTSSVKMYPNPVQNTLSIEANSEIQSVTVYNMLGQAVMKASPNANAVTLQTNDLQKGVYMVTTEIDGNLSTSKVIKE
jgi:hypothetical protein